MRYSTSQMASYCIEAASDISIEKTSTTLLLFFTRSVFFLFVVCSSSFPIAVCSSYVLLFCFRLDYFYQSGAKCQYSICCLCGFFVPHLTLCNERYAMHINKCNPNHFPSLFLWHPLFTSDIFYFWCFMCAVQLNANKRSAKMQVVTVHL